MPTLKKMILEELNNFLFNNFRKEIKVINPIFWDVELKSKIVLLFYWS